MVSPVQVFRMLSRTNGSDEANDVPVRVRADGGNLLDAGACDCPPLGLLLGCARPVLASIASFKARKGFL